MTDVVEKNPDVFELPGIGRNFRLFLALVAGLAALSLIVGGIAGGISLIKYEGELVWGLYAFLFIVPAGIVALYVSLIKKETRLIYPS